MYGTIDLNMLETKRSTLNLLDILVLAIIFFGLPIWQSVSMYLTSMQDSTQAGFDFNTISDSMQWISIAQEIILLGVAALYLWVRKFDFRVLNFKVTKWTLPICLGLIIAGAAASDLGMWATQTVFPGTAIMADTEIIEDTASAAQTGVQAMTELPRITFMTVLFALLNGFFEEIFFMGLVFATSRKALPWALLFSILVRFSFHIYQGMPAAVGITCMGLVFMLCRTKIRELVPFTLAHSFFDIFGVTLWFWIYQIIY